ncbi:MAG: exosortase-associated EpsI family protein [Isosphaeraceae bacterium]
MKTATGVVAAMVLIIGVGLVHGSWTNRWRMAPGLAELAAHLESVPMAVGDWVAARREMSPRELAATGATGCLSRTYTNPKTGVAVSVLLLCGLPGDVTVHTPEACYPGAGYTLATPTNHIRRYGSDGQTAEFQTAVARRGGAKPSVLRIYWSWRGSKGWAAPQDARWRLAAEPILSKLYVIRETGGRVSDPHDDPSEEFLALLLPELDLMMSEATPGCRAETSVACPAVISGQ